ncbi:transcription factor cys6 protein [Colletotrichum incanum]|uniref:Transcription factor cys6 protein n=1 Tax=Colletotrichum incanum TaxID=1573173 RepID=A0A167CBR3_COLIC|nr:transcription factor cys6 protein [Colletotrichum incanum]
MYGTLSFSKGNKRSSAEFHAFSEVHKRRLRQPACDECRIARVKCRGKSDSEKCARCQGTGRACTYNSTRRRSQHSGKPTEPPEPTHTTDDTDEDNGDKDGESTPSAPLTLESTSSPQGSTLPQDTHTKWWECRFEPFDLFVEPGTDLAIDESQNASAQKQIDGDSSSGSANDNDGVLHLTDLELASVVIGQNDPHHYGFSVPCNEFQSKISLSTPSRSSPPTPSLVWSTVSGHVEHQKPPSLSSDMQLDHPASLQHKSDTQDDATHASTLAEFSDLIDVMQFAEGPSISGSATPTSNSCTCLQDLTATLFSLRSRPERTQVDHFLLLFKQVMHKWEAVETCVRACRVSRSFALLVLMNVQELVTLLLEATSSANPSNSTSGRRDSVLAISMGTFTVEDGADQRIIARMLLAVRMKELHSFILRISSQMKLAGLDDIFTDFHHQIEMLRRAFTL